MTSDPLELARAELQKLRDADDWNEATPVVHVNVQPPAARRSTPPPPPRSLRAPAQQSTLQVVLTFAGGAINRMPPAGIVAVAIALIAAWAYLAVHGKAPVP